MISPTLKIVSIGIGISGAVGVAGGVLYLKSSSTNKKVVNLIKTKSIFEFLKEENLQLIKDSSDASWTEKWTTFIDDYQSTELESEWNFTEWENDKQNRNVVPQKFKDNCGRNGRWKVEDKEDDVYKKVKKYCTKALSAG